VLTLNIGSPVGAPAATIAKAEKSESTARQFIEGDQYKASA